MKKNFLLKFTYLIDLGTDSLNSCDYPLYAQKLCSLVTKEDKGILICGSGIGMNIAANRFSHIRASVIHSLEELKLARAHNDLNVLCLAGRNFSLPEEELLSLFLNTPFEEGRHLKRLDLI